MKRREMAKQKSSPRGTQTDKPSLAAILDGFGIEYRDVFGWQTIACPFHDEADPSFRINLDEGAFVCKAYACGKSGGDAFEFIKLYEGVDYPTALQTAERITGTSYGSVRGRPGAEQRINRVSEGSGFRPIYNRAVSTRRSSQSNRWA